MPVVICGWTGKEMLIDEPGGVAYITHKDGMITKVARNEEEALEQVMEVTEGEVEQPLEEV